MKTIMTVLFRDKLKSKLHLIPHRQDCRQVATKRSYFPTSVDMSVLNHKGDNEFPVKQEGKCHMCSKMLG
jgi:hypothetical protein